ncbi:MAG: PmoA family protein [Chloroflexota bacterium]|nr:PmoA family protein [Chloroflexota bacterium]
MITLHDDTAVIEIRDDERLLLRYVYQSQMDADLSSRPYLHPVNTLGGVTVTDVQPADHRWHMGISFAIPDVSATNFWGGPTYVSGKGYTGLDDHGRVVNIDWQHQQADTATATLAHTLHWHAHDGATIIHECRQLDMELLPNENAYALTFLITLLNVTAADLRFASPAANGEPNGIGYGGLFWRGAPSFLNGRIISEQGEGEVLRGSRSDWLGYASPNASLLFVDHRANPTYPTPWFVRNQQYPGVCFSLAAPRAYLLPPHTPLTLRHTILIADGTMDGAAFAERYNRLA